MHGSMKTEGARCRDRYTTAVGVNRKCNRLSGRASAGFEVSRCTQLLDRNKVAARLTFFSTPPSPETSTHSAPPSAVLGSIVYAEKQEQLICFPLQPESRGLFVPMGGGGISGFHQPGGCGVFNLFLKPQASSLRLWKKVGCCRTTLPPRLESWVGTLAHAWYRESSSLMAISSSCTKHTLCEEHGRETNPGKLLQLSKDTKKRRFAAPNTQAPPDMMSQA